jgi:hypothetical protein
MPAHPAAILVPAVSAAPGDRLGPGSGSVEGVGASRSSNVATISHRSSFVRPKPGRLSLVSSEMMQARLRSLFLDPWLPVPYLVAFTPSLPSSREPRRAVFFATASSSHLMTVQVRLEHLSLLFVFVGRTSFRSPWARVPKTALLPTRSRQGTCISSQDPRETRTAVRARLCSHLSSSCSLS